MPRQAVHIAPAIVKNDLALVRHNRGPNRCYQGHLMREYVIAYRLIIARRIQAFVVFHKFATSADGDVSFKFRSYVG